MIFSSNREFYLELIFVVSHLLVKGVKNLDDFSVFVARAYLKMIFANLIYHKFSGTF